MTELDSTTFPAVTIAGVFEAAANVTGWKRTNLGPMVEVSGDGYTWVVELPASGEGKARITGRTGYGGSEFFTVEASSTQTAAIVEGYMSSMRI